MEKRKFLIPSIQIDDPICVFCDRTKSGNYPDGFSRELCEKVSLRLEENGIKYAIVLEKYGVKVFVSRDDKGLIKEISQKSEIKSWIIFLKQSPLI